MNKLQKIWNYLTKPGFSRFLLSFMHNGYLLEIGWYDTYFKRESIDVNGDPIPWTTYSYIEFIKTYLQPGMLMFEYGTGNSTLFYAKYVNRLISVEHNENWYKKIKAELPDNCKLILNDVKSDAYICPNELKENKFDVIVVDGRRRNDCVVKSERYLKESGIIILDDSEREYYTDGINYLKQKGYKKLDFWGISPMYFHNKCTTVFYKRL